MIPIPTGFNKGLSRSQNYRGIALSSLFSKIFNHCIISCEDVALESDDLQFAYKSGMSNIQCAYVVTETINYYLHNISDIYIYIYLSICVCVYVCVCTIDASKAFDRVNLFVLYLTC